MKKAEKMKAEKLQSFQLQSEKSESVLGFYMQHSSFVKKDALH